MTNEDQDMPASEDTTCPNNTYLTEGEIGDTVLPILPIPNKLLTDVTKNCLPIYVDDIFDVCFTYRRFYDY